MAKPGLAKFLYESASEEREHAMLMLDYLQLRGVTYDEDYEFNYSGIFDTVRFSKNYTWTTRGQ